MTASELIALADERAELMAKNAAATSWGAAVGARHERIKEIDGLLAANQSGSERAGVDTRPRPSDCVNPMQCGWHHVRTEPEINMWLCSQPGCNHMARAQTALATPPAQPAPKGGDEVERLRDAVSLALQYLPAQPSGSDAQKDIARIHDLIAGKAVAWDKAHVSESPSTHGKPDGAVQPFEHHHVLAEWMQKLANVGVPGWSLIDWQSFTDALNSALSRNAAEAPLSLSCDFAQVFPGGKLDDSTYSKIEDTLDKIEAPAQDATGKWLSLHERIAALSPKIAAAETSPGDVLAMKEACKRVALDMAAKQRATNEKYPDHAAAYPSWRNAVLNYEEVAAAIDRLDVKAEAKSQEPEAVAVKPLEWYEEPLRSPDQPAWNADSPVGAYRVFKAWWGKENKDGWIGNGEFHHTEAAAKAAAQADYEERVRSALIRPTTKPEAPAISLNGVTQVVYDHGPSFSWDECKKIAGSLLARFHITDRDARS